MLRALELHGFKSFADKTRFEFPAGITVIVGPNGSGKSNVVDAIKWVLGEQSAKSLRGKEMSDVIYKGSGTDSRRPMNTAEATIIFDNDDGRLPVESDEVRVTRRVYRGGEGEYLINGEPCRLREIKDLFRGTGVGADAYSLIEQGKVDTLLQSSPKDRRAIFEEAAGISRFKAKKVEAQRRMERVEQNLLRLSDIVEEVETRLRSIRNQAGKARRYREYTERLKELRTQVGLVDWRRLTQELESLGAELAVTGEASREKSQEAEELENRSLDLVAELERLEKAIRDDDQQQALLRERAATLKSISEHQVQRAAEQEALASRHRARLSAMTVRVGDLHTQHHQVRASLAEASQTHQQAADQVGQLGGELAAIEGQLDRLRQAGQGDRHEQLERTKLTTRLAEQIRSAEERRQLAHEAAQRHQSRVDDLVRSLEGHVLRREDFEQRESDLADRVARRAEQRQSLENSLETMRRQLAAQQEELSQEQGKLAGMRQRAEVLEDLEKRQEGLGAGVREVLAGRQRDPGGPMGEVLGMVADLLQVQVDLAPLIELALGERAQHLVVRGSRLMELVQAGQFHFAGRVALLPLQSVQLQVAAEQPRLEGKPGVIGRADRFVKVEPQMAPLVEHLLADTWFVEDLSQALALRERTGDELRFITSAGEMLETDGTLKVGPRAAVAGIISRRSQLRLLGSQVSQLSRKVDELSETCASLRQAIGDGQAELKELIQEHSVESDHLAEHRAELRAAKELCQQLESQLESAQADLTALRGQHAAADTVLESARSNVQQAQAELSELAARLRRVDQEIVELNQRRGELQKQVTAAEVELARRVQRLDALEAQLAQLEADQREREKNLSEARAQLADALAQRRLADRKVLASTSELADLGLSQETLARQAQTQLDERQGLTQRRADLARQAQARRVEQRKVDQRHHQLEMQESDIRHQRTTMVERLREDYGIELADLERQPSAEELEQRDAVEGEITELRRKISNIGAVNMEALNELDELEERFTLLSTQYQDLVEAKETLEKIIHRINADSRRMFVETLEAVRTNFQNLFRKVFGGGQADIVLEEGVDVLEGGVDILATPPGKHSLGISLLSGGERALTAVTLLLAIFEFRPSPFCVLDEVDGPLDEANIGRFVDVLRSFLSWTRFVVVTHSKKTMTAANTLYGVTMQESGVSKRVSVRFEDVSEDGAISAQTIERSPNDEESDGRGAA